MKQHTIIFVPHVRAKFRKWRLSTLQVALILGSLALLTVGGIVAIISYFSATIDREQLGKLEQENQVLRETNEGFGTSIRELEQKVEEYSERIQELAIVAGLSEPSPGEAGIGGSASLDGDADREDQLLDLEARLQRMDLDMLHLQTGFDQRQLQISRTPAISPVKGLLTSGFGYRKDPFTSRRTFHHGIDIVAPYGRPVRATGDGLVTKAGRDVGLGQTVSISHDFGLVTRYGHLSKLTVERGAFVKRGDVIGHVGNTGRSTGVHLHYEVHVDGRPDNPLGYILDGTRE